MSVKVQLAPNYGDNPRKELFNELIDKLSNVELVPEETPLDNISFRFYFDKDLFNKTKKLEDVTVSQLLEFQERDFSKALLDIVDSSFFLNQKDGSLLTLCTVCAGAVTCPNAEVQEDIYMHTGRLAFIVENPLREEDIKQPISDDSFERDEPTILWFGDKKDIFTVRREQVEGNNIHTLNYSDSNFNKKLTKKLDTTDIVYLPKPFRQEDIADRYNRASYALAVGKFVIAPDLNRELFFDGTLSEGLDFYNKNDLLDWVEQKQALLLEKEGINKSLRIMKEVFNPDRHEDYNSSLEFFLEDLDELLF